jgi:hypothetical protein
MEPENRVGGTDRYAYHLQCGDRETKLSLNASPEEVVDLLKDVASVLGHPWGDLRHQVQVLYQASRQGAWIPLLNVERMEQTRLLPEFEGERQADRPTKVQSGRHSLGHQIFSCVRWIYADHKTLSAGAESLDKASLRTLRLLDKLLRLVEAVSERDVDDKMLLMEHGLKGKPLKEMVWILHTSSRSIDRTKAEYCEALTAAVEAAFTPKERLDLREYLRLRKKRRHAPGGRP